jgi:uncharacterized protein DUF5681
MSYEIGYGKPPPGWVKGQSGNPGGLPRGVPRVSVALMRLVRCGAGEDFRVETKADELALALYDKARGGDVQALSLVFDRLEGRVPQTLNLTAGSQSDQELAREMLAGLISSGKTQDEARALLLEVGVDASDIE